MQNLEYWLVAQVGLDLLILGVVAFFLLRTRGLKQKLTSLASAENPLAGKLEELSQTVTAWEKRLQLVEELAQALGERLASFSGGQSVRTGFPTGQARPLERGSGAILRAQVEELARQGYPPEEIARRLSLQLAEVKVALDLARVRPV